MSCVAEASAARNANSAKVPIAGRRVGRGQPQQSADDHRLAQDDPALAPPQPAEQRRPEPVDQRRPQELEALGQPDPRQHADRRQVDLGLAQPGVERPISSAKGSPEEKPKASIDPVLRFATRASSVSPSAGRRSAVAIQLLLPTS